MQVKIGGHIYEKVIAVSSSGADITTGGTEVLNQIIDDVSPTLTYVCEAIPGTVATAASWRCQRITVTGTVTEIRFAGNGLFNQIANNRASLTY